MTNPLQRTGKRILDGTDTPSWWIGVQVLLGIAFLIYLLVAFGNSDTPGPDTVAGPFGNGGVASPTGPPVATPDAGGPAADPTAAPSQDPTTTPSDAGTATVAAAGGGQIDVSQQALDIARLAAAAHMTGDWTQVPLAPGTSAPDSGGQWTDPIIGEVAARRINDALLQFLVEVDPDGPGPEPARSLTLHTALTDGGWGLRGQ